jgi:hypothetical protein
MYKIISFTLEKFSLYLNFLLGPLNESDFFLFFTNVT